MEDMYSAQRGVPPMVGRVVSLLYASLGMVGYVHQVIYHPMYTLGTPCCMYTLHYMAT